MRYTLDRHQLIYLLKRYRQERPGAPNELLTKIYDNNLTQSTVKENSDLQNDANRMVTVDNIHPCRSSGDGDYAFTQQQLRDLLGEDYENVKQHYDQTALSFPFLIIRALYPNTETKEIVGPQQQTAIANFKHQFGELNLEIENLSFRTIELVRKDEFVKSEQQLPVATKLKVTRRGFEVEEFSTDNFEIYYQLRGGFSRRLGTAFHTIFNSSDNVDRSDAAAFFGLPAKGNPFNYLTGVLFLATTAKNILKFATEFVPAIFEEGFGFLADRAKRDLLLQQNKPENERSALQTGWAYARIGVFSALQYTFKAVRNITMRVTSPIRSAKEAYEFGHKYGGKPLGYLLGGLSAAASVVTTGLVAALAAPAILGGSAAVGLFGVVSAVAHLPVVSTIGAALSKTAATLGVKNFGGFAITQAASATAASFAVAATVALAPYRAIKSFIGNLFKSRNTGVPSNEASQNPDALTTAKERTPSIVGDLTNKPGSTSTGNILSNIRQGSDVVRADSPTPPPLPPSPLAGEAPPELLPQPGNAAAPQPAAAPIAAPQSDQSAPMAPPQTAQTQKDDEVASNAPRP